MADVFDSVEPEEYWRNELSKLTGVIMESELVIGKLVIALNNIKKDIQKAERWEPHDYGLETIVTEIDQVLNENQLNDL
tara:strand:- start:12020 stop:12256 length:237 start_codon:yes stop_codon:yes gene_type:complete